MTGDPAASDTSRFPAPVYKETVLAPLFDGAKTHFADALLAINQAHAVMLAETGILDRHDVGRLLAGLAAVDAETDRDALVYTGAVEDYFFHVEAELAARLGPDLAGRLHTGRSRNDMDHTMFKLRLAERMDGLIDDLTGLVDTLLTVAEREAGTIVVAFTHGQPAQPSTYGHILGAFVEVLVRAEARLRAAADGLARCPMGAAAITTTGFPIDRHRVAELLGFEAPLENSYGCIAAVDYTTAVYGALKLLFVDVGRFVQLLDHWTKFETRQLYVPNAFVQISSIMPQKRNPVPVEHLRLLSSLAMGRADMVVDAMRNTPFADMNDSEGEVQAAGYAAFDAAGRALRLLAGLIGECRIDGAAVADLIDRSCLTITELADSLVRLEDLSFRQAHDVAGRVSRHVVASGGGMSALGFDVFAEVFRAAVGRPTEVDANTFARLVSPEYFVSVRERFGGPGRQSMAASLTGYRRGLDDARAALHARRTRRMRAANLRAERVAALVADGGQDNRASE